MNIQYFNALDLDFLRREKQTTKVFFPVFMTVTFYRETQCSLAFSLVCLFIQFSHSNYLRIVVSVITGTQNVQFYDNHRYLCIPRTLSLICLDICMWIYHLLVSSVIAFHLGKMCILFVFLKLNCNYIQLLEKRIIE